MDLDELRRKRIKLFASPTSRLDEVASSSHSDITKMATHETYPGIIQNPQSPRNQVGYAPGMGLPVGSAPDISDDEKYARQLQAEIEQEERPKSHGNQSAFALPSHIANNLTEDEILANQLQGQFGQEYNSQNPFQGGPYAEIPGLAEMMAEDAKVARELQAEFDNLVDDTLPPPRSSSVTPKPIVKLPPSPLNVKMEELISDKSDDAYNVRQFASTFKLVDCGICGKQLSLERDKVTSYFTRIASNADSKDIEFLIRCTACPGKTCPGCSEAITAAGMSYGNTASNGVHATWHCDQGRLCLIWFLLSGFDHVATHNKIQVKSSIKSKPAKDDATTRWRRANAKKKNPAGIGYSSDSQGYDDYTVDYYGLEDEFDGLGVPPPSLMPLSTNPPPPPMPSSTNPPPTPGPTSTNQFTSSTNQFTPSFPSPFLQPSDISPSDILPGDKWPPHSQPPSAYVQPQIPSSFYPSQPAPPPYLPMSTGSWLPSAYSTYAQSPATSMHPAAASPHQQLSRYKRKVQVAEPARVDPDDGVTTYIMSLLAATLPHPAEQLVPTAFDHNPPEVLASMLKRSSILDRAAELLHNDSLDNATERFHLYNNLVSFMRAVNGSDGTMRSILHDRRQINKAGHDLLKLSLCEPTRLIGEKVESAKSLASSMENLISQCKRMLNVWRASTDALQSDEEQQMLLLCTLLSECAALILGNAQVQSTLQNPEATLQDKDEWQKTLRVLSVPDATILEQHYYAKEVDALLASNPPRHRMARILKELVSLETDLPPGIFVRHGESRLDVMKIVIIGPQGTPYENGMFEFDLVCPLEYPNEPPHMQLKTTGGGTVGFNPNLYADGKVCLSLLGTWHGEGWKAGQSSLFQVFVSIQAMIFNEEPWINEPGRDIHRGSEKCKIYNRTLYPSVVKYAMIEWIEGKRTKPPSYKSGGRRLGAAGEDPKNRIYGEDIWVDVSKKHFEVNEAKIVKTVCSWANDKPSPTARKRKSKQRPGGSGWTHPGPPGWIAANGSPFMGPGRTIGVGDDAAAPSSSALATFDASKLKESDSLVSKLTEVLKQLQENMKHHTGFAGAEEWDSEMEED